MPVNKNKLGKAKKSRREISSSLSCDSNFGGQDQIFMGLTQEEPYKKQKSNKNVPPLPPIIDLCSIESDDDGVGVDVCQNGMYIHCNPIIITFN